jgi:transcriptional regulator with XRE-family HTH domain
MRSISLIEGNKQQPTITTIENLSKALGMSMVELIQEVEVHTN